MPERINHNPDVLSCLANLSNDEVLTPPEVANAMLDMLPQELFEDPNARFLDPACKSGIFLREIAKRLLKGLDKKIPDLQERIDHIFHQQLYAIAITELTALMSRRSVYCTKAANSIYSVSKFESGDGNIRFKRTEHGWASKDKDAKCTCCGASRDQFDRGKELETYAYEFIHTIASEEIKNMKFDLVISNPPYQLSDGGQGASASSIYHLFVEKAMKLKPMYLSMIIPARWYTNGKGKGIKEFRKGMLNDKHISTLVDYKNSADCFPGVNIAGGVCYFLWERDYQGECLIKNANNSSIINETRRNLNEFSVLVRDNIAVKIIEKAMKNNKSMSTLVKQYSYFAVRSYERGVEKKTTNNDVVLLSSNGKGFYPKSKIVDKDSILGNYKVIITYAMSGGNKPSSEGNYQVVSSLQCLSPNEVCTETYLVLGAFKEKENALALESYTKTKFFRFLLLQALTSIHITRDSFIFIPIQDFSKSWTDNELYRKYNLTDDEIAFIESMIRPMDVGGSDE